MKGIVYFIGAGPGDPGLLTLAGKEILEKADMVVYAGSLVNRKILSFAGENARIIDSSSLTLSNIIDHMVTAAKKGMTVARLHTGDPSVYGAIAEQTELLEREDIAFVIVPGVSSVFAAAASLKMEYTLPGITQTLILTRRSGRTNVPEQESLRLLARHGASMAIFLSAGMIRETIHDLMDGGYSNSTPAAVVYRASWPDEKCVIGTLETIADKAAREGIERQALILVGEAVGKRVEKFSRLYAPDFTHGFRTEKNRATGTTAIVALTRRGWHTGKKIQQSLGDAELFLPSKFTEAAQDSGVSFYNDVGEMVFDVFNRYSGIVLIMATGIAVRLLAPLLRSKWKDPAVVTMDDGGRNIISLLSGHWGGANDLAVKLSHVLGGNPVITTESDVMGFPAIDGIIKLLTGGAVPEKTDLIKTIQTMILDDNDVGFYPKELRLVPKMEGHPNIHFFDSIEALVCSPCGAGVIVSHLAALPVKTHDHLLIIAPKDLVVGIGCHKGTSAEEIEACVHEVFLERNLSVGSIGRICSIEHKREEKGLVSFARSCNVPVQFFSSREINTVHVPSPVSEGASRAMGVHGVAEPCAVLGADGGKLLTFKKKMKNVTIAVAHIPLQQFLTKLGVD